jgi:hypothetical protein
MKMIGLYLPIFMLLMVVGCKENLSKNTTTVKFSRDEKGRILIPFAINNTVVYGMFDTGATYSLIEESDRKRVDIEISDDTTAFRFPEVDNVAYSAMRTRETNVSFNGVDLKKSVAFIIADDSAVNSTTRDYMTLDNALKFEAPADLTIIGNDIIDQLNWLFDFDNNDLTVSDKPIPFDTINSVIIHYRDKRGYKFCSLYLPGTGLLNNVMIDSGAAGIRVGDELYSTLLALPDTTCDRRNDRLIKIARYEKYKRSPDSVNLHRPFVDLNDDSNILIYNGLRWHPPLATFDHRKDINGLIAFSHSSGYSYMYLDTRNKKIYLK